MASRRIRFVLVAVEYFTKWVEGALSSVMQDDVISMIFNDIIFRFSVPKEIVTDQSKQIYDVKCRRLPQRA